MTPPQERAALLVWGASCAVGGVVAAVITGTWLAVLMGCWAGAFLVALGWGAIP